jgi:RNA polymerase sigma-70 factor, ECF subfamily
VSIPTGPRHRISRVEARGVPASRPDRAVPPPRDDETDLERLLGLVARGDQDAFEAIYDKLSGPAYGLVRKVLRDPAQSEEVTQEVMLEVWRSASRFDPARGSATSWALTIAHRRAVDRVRSETAAADREQRSAAFPFEVDDVAETVEASLAAEQVRHCLDGLTELQREAITLAYYGGYTYPQVASRLKVALGTVKTRIRDGLMRLGNCLGRSW